MTNTVLDASALLALFNTEKGADLVAEALPGAFISTVNISEVVSRLSEAGIPEDSIRLSLDSLDIDIVPFDTGQAFLTGMMRANTRDAGLSLGDRACLSLGKSLDIEVLTADRMWIGLDVGVKIKVIR